MEKKQYFNFPKSITDFFYTDMSKFQVATWIIINTNYSEEEFNGLKQYQCYFSYSILESLFKISRSKLHKLVRELEKEGVFTWVYKSKAKNKPSIIKYELYYKTANGSANGSSNASALDNTGLEDKSRTVHRTVERTLSNTISNTKSNIYSDIFNFWNDKGIKKHRSLSISIKQSIDKALKEFTVEEIKQAISNYATILHDETYYFSYIWGLDEFLVKKDKDRIRQLPQFLNEGSKWINYQNSKNKNNIIHLNNREFKRTPVSNNNDYYKNMSKEDYY